MTAFTYRAATSAGKLVTGVIDAASVDEVREKLEEMSVLPIEISSEAGPTRSWTEIQIQNPFRRVSRRDRLAMTQQLSAMVAAGVPLDRALSILAELADNPIQKEMLQEIVHAVTSGSSLAEALSRHPRVFPPLYVNMVRAGEAGGVLDLVLQRLAEFLEQMEELRSYVVSALAYPAILVGVGSAAVIFLMTAVIPRFVTILDGMGQAIPLSTRILMATSDGIRDYWWIGVAVGVGGFFGFRSWRQTEAGRLRWDQFQMSLPGLGSVTRKLALSRFARTLGTLSTSGVPILDALFIVKDVVGNEVVSQAILRVHGGVREGEGIADPLQETGVFPSMAIHMITVGEETGRLDRMLHQIADIYESDVRNAIKRLTALLEPMMILVMAAIVGFIVLSLVTAIMSVTSAAGG